MAKQVPAWTVTIDAPPEAVWPYIGDLDRHDDWSPKPFAIEWTSGQPNAVGSQFRSKGELPQDKDHDMEGTVAVSEAPSKLVIDSHDETGEFVNTLTLVPSNGKTTVTRTVEFPARKGAWVVLFPILMPIVIKPAIQKGMNMLKTKVEGGKAA